MKQKKLGDLLKKMASHSSFEKEGNAGIVNLNDEFSQMVMGGKFLTNNAACVGTNASCGNVACQGTTNTVCANGTCLAPKIVPIINI